MMFCGGAIVFEHYTLCPFYKAYAGLIAGLTDLDAVDVVVRLGMTAKICNDRCKGKKEGSDE
jgi:hypothetical protein